MSQVRLYLAGPMTGHPEHNIPAFTEAAKDIRARGYEVVSPAEGVEDQSEKSWEDWMRRDIAMLVTCDGLACLPGWQNSRGASLETFIATALGMPLLCAERLVVLEPKLSLDAILREVGCWQASTFPNATPASCAEHLRREAEELADNPTDPEEMADVMMLLYGLSSSAGVDLRQAVADKLRKNRQRLWGQPDRHGVVEHIRGVTHTPATTS